MKAAAVLRSSLPVSTTVGLAYANQHWSLRREHIHISITQTYRAVYLIGYMPSGCLFIEEYELIILC